MQEFYNYYDATYNLDIMKLSFESLNWISKYVREQRNYANDSRYIRIITELVDPNNYVKIQSAFELLFNDIFANRVDIALLHSLMPPLTKSY